MFQDATGFDVLIAFSHCCENFFFVGEEAVHAFLGHFVWGSVCLRSEVLNPFFLTGREMDSHEQTLSAFAHRVNSEYVTFTDRYFDRTILG
jgi:hypothetical protein